jgi:MFS superfamily sulfate permease-like transporter
MYFCRDEILSPWLEWLQFSQSEPGSVRIAYLIMVHSLETVRGVDRILHRLYDQKHTFVIHLDK